MGRPKGYEPNEVLRSAARLFLERGYRSVSVQDLVEATGLNRFAIYEKFGGKVGLLHETLDYYLDEQLTNGVMSVLTDDGADLETLLGTLEQIRAQNSDESRPAGCLVTNTSIELNGSDVRVEGVVERLTSAQRGIVSRVLENAKRSGSVGADFDVAERSEYFVTMLHAFHALSLVSRPSADRFITVVQREVTSWGRASAGKLRAATPVLD